MNVHKVTIDENGDAILDLGNDLCDKLGWAVGDTLNWTMNEDGTVTINKVSKPAVETELVLVECISSYRVRYVVEVPKGKSEWASDTVAMHEAKEFSQRWMGENIVSTRVIDKQEFLDLCTTDNEYLSHWVPEKKEEALLTKWVAKE